MKRAALLLLLTAAVTVMADRQRTTRPHLQPGAVVAAVDTVAAPDTVALAAAEVSLSGYDKPREANREAFFLTNNTDSAFCAVEVDIEYLDMRGRQLHRRSCWVNLDLPAGETRRAEIPTWDRQHTFYYYLNTRPRRSNATPYKVKASAVRAVR